ncbi:hypothetical protein [Streptomyces rhizosphaericus]|uniref:Uncharacterized protein n=1 Tax=Streptomyces rhizosphaericus TaxID=114699 RepID=A0A6G4AQ58_9ACTN|nr:hypothetical protein [Streptomyces rhizosphaericus]NEW75475.1 hypothetical protein [Streptomyces rhizosphaericus]
MTTTTTNVTIKDTSQLAQGDIVRTHRMRVRLDRGASHERSDCTVYAWTGTVLNLDEVREQGHVPMSCLRTERWQSGQGWVTDREDVWVVQGNERAEWIVENPS